MSLPTLLLHGTDHLNHAPETLSEPPPPPLTSQTLPLQTRTLVEPLSLKVGTDFVPRAVDLQTAKGAADIHTPVDIDLDGPADTWSVGGKWIGKDKGLWSGGMGWAGGAIGGV